MTDSVVSVKGLVNQFGNNRVHDGLDLEVHKGEILSIVKAKATAAGRLMTDDEYRAVVAEAL